MATYGQEEAGQKRLFLLSILMIVYFASGICSLMDEVVWLRLLKLIIGNTVYASSIVVSVFMGGLALGAAIMARRCRRFKRPLRAYALIELLIALCVLCSPAALRFADSLYVWIWRSIRPGEGVLILCQSMISGVILLVPTVLMGMTLPLLAMFTSSLERRSVPLVGRLYAVNMLGAATGVLLAGFVLIRVIGVTWTLRVSAVLNVGVAFGGYILHRRFEFVSITSSGEASHGHSFRRQPDGLALLACGFFLSGFVCIGYELLWMRSIVHSIGNYTYVFSAVLTVYLLGNVTGTAIASRLIKNVRRPALAYSVVLFSLGVFGVCYLPWLTICNFHLLPAISTQPEMAFLAGLLPLRMSKPLIECAVLFLGPSVLMGIGFPLMLQAWVNRRGSVGASTGWAYALNTFGAVLGGVLTGFVLIPLMGLQQSVVLMGLAALWLAALMWLRFMQPTLCRWFVRLALPICALSISVATTYIPQDLFLRTVALSGRVFGHEIVAMEEGINTTVSVHEDSEYRSRYLYTSGCIVAGTSPGFRGDQKMLGHFPALLNPRTRRTLSVGFGSGESTTCLAMHEIEEVDCVEIAPEVVACALRYFPEFHSGGVLHPNVNMIYMDARNYLHLTERSYDAIISDCTGMSRFAENGSLFTRDYFQCARRRLSGGGMFMSWIDTYSTESEPVINSVLGTMMEVFPHVTLWYMTPEPAPFFMVVGSQEPQMFRVRHIMQQMRKAEVGKSLANVNVSSVADVLSCYIADERDIARSFQGFRRNTDDRPFVEFCTVHDPAGRGIMRNFFETVQSESIWQHLDWRGLAEAERDDVMAGLQRVRRVARCVQLSQTAETYGQSLMHCMNGLQIDPRYPALCTAKRAIEEHLLNSGLQCLAEDNRAGAMRAAETMLEHDPNSANGWVLLSQVRRHKGAGSQALEAARRAIAEAPDDLYAHYNLWSVLVSLEELEQGRAAMDRAVEMFGGNSGLKTTEAHSRLGF